MHKEVIRNVIPLILAMIIMFPIKKYVIYITYLERGYKTIGGEYCLIFMLYWTILRIIYKVLNTLEAKYERGCKKGRS